MKQSFLFALLLSLACTFGQAQTWVQKMQDPNANFYDVQQEFETYWNTHDRTEKGKGYKAFKRWEHFVGPRVYPSGDLSQLQQTGVNYAAWQQQYNASQVSGKKKGGSAQTASATFTAIGPFGPISGSAGGQFLKSGRLNFITINPSNPQDLWVGAPAGGLWHSTNGGVSWTTNTDNLPVTGCSDLAIDPTNTLVMYLATGDGDGGDNRTIGVLKSTDGGQTWNTTGLTSNVSSYFLIRRLIINPVNPQILLAATNQGIYRTTNGGTSWSVVSNGPTCFDLEFKPGNPNVVYAGGYSFRMSTNGGASFFQVSSGIVTSSARMAVAVTPADSQYVYVLVGSSATNGFQGLYRSTNGGTSFAVMSTTPNLLGWQSNGSDSNGQAWYDLCVAASPLNKDEVVTGGVNVWRSTNGGASWSIYGHWTGNGAPFTHADHHDLEFHSSGTLYDVNDGTVYRRTSTGWTEISGTMNISQIYRLGMSSLTPNKWITGHQDNGTSIWDGTIYDAGIGGDGMDCFFDRTNDQVVFGETQNGGLRKSTNGGANWSMCKTGLPSTDGPWLTVWKQDPQNATTLYVAYDNLYKSTNLAASWTTLTPVPGSGDINEFAIAPSNNQVIYVARNTGIYKTVNGGTSWTNVTNGVPVGSASPEYICIDPTDPSNAWVVLSGYSAGNKVYMTTNGGTSWTNWSANLPNLPANCCLYHPGSSDRIYVGMDVGIYYRDNASGSWTLYNAGLPNVPVSELEISPASPTLLHAATYGRGVWVASLASLAPAPPVSNFALNVPAKCTYTPLTLTDMSTNAPTTWNWTISPGTGYSVSSLSVQNPVVQFTATGIYTVQLQADNTLGSGSVFSQTFAVLQTPTVNVVASTQSSICSGSPISYTASGASSYTWTHNGGGGQVATYYPLVSTVYTVTGFLNNCPNAKTVSVSVQAGPAFSVTGSNTLCAGNSLSLIASTAPNYSWNTGGQQSQVVVSPSVSTTYSVSSIGANGCKTSKSHAVSVFAAPVFTVTASDTTICEGESTDMFAAGANSFTWEPGSIVGYTTTQVFGGPLTYTIYGVDHKGCSNVAYFSVQVSECVGLEETVGQSPAFTVFPNPSDGLFYIRASGSSLQAGYRISDATGRVLQHGDLAGDKAIRVIDLSDFSAGVYFLHVGRDGRGQSVRLLKTN